MLCIQRVVLRAERRERTRTAAQVLVRVVVEAIAMKQMPASTHSGAARTLAKPMSCVTAASLQDCAARRWHSSLNRRPSG
jgi:hypothetical protein